MKISLKKIIKNILRSVGINTTPEKIHQWFSYRSLQLAIKEQKLDKMLLRLREIEPDISHQEASTKKSFNQYWEFKRRGLQSFQCALMLEGLERFSKRSLTVVDIGDSAGTHMLYLKELSRPKYEIDTIGVNLDPRAIEKIRARGQKAILCRAEELDLKDRYIDMYTSFEMVEHLHNPSIFFRRLAKRSACNKMLITVPYLRQSRIGLHNIRHNYRKEVFAEDEHIFELSPFDWELLLLHSGWKVIQAKVYFQYPRNIPIISGLLANFWKKFDYEGFWGAILEKDTSFSDCYKDWEE